MRSKLVAIVASIYIIAALTIFYFFAEYIVVNLVSLLRDGELDPRGTELSDFENFVFDALVLIFFLSSLLLSSFQLVSYLYPEFVKKAESFEPKSRFDVVCHVSNDEEVSVLMALKEDGGKLYKFELSRKTGLSRMKIHRIVLRFEQRNLVDVEKVGRNSRVVLKNWLLAS